MEEKTKAEDVYPGYLSAVDELYEALVNLSKEIRCIHEYADFGGKVGAALKAADAAISKFQGSS